MASKKSTLVTTKKQYPKQYFKNIEDLYKYKLNSFICYARRFLINKDRAIDIVHAAFEKSLEYRAKKPERNFREQVVNWLIIKECKKSNKIYSKEISNTIDYDYQEHKTHENITKQSLDEHDRDNKIFFTTPKDIPTDYN